VDHFVCDGKAWLIYINDMLNKNLHDVLFDLIVWNDKKCMHIVWCMCHECKDSEAKSLGKIKVGKKIPTNRDSCCLYTKLRNFIVYLGWRGDRHHIKQEKDRPYRDDEDSVSEKKDNDRKKKRHCKIKTKDMASTLFICPKWCFETVKHLRI